MIFNAVRTQYAVFYHYLNVGFIHSAIGRPRLEERVPAMYLPGGDRQGEEG